MPHTTVAVFAVVPHASDKIAGYPLTPRFIVRDAGLQRLLVGGIAAGRGGGLISISLDTGAIKPLRVGDSSALAIDADDNKIFVAIAGLPQIDVLDRKSLQRIDRILLNDPAETLSYDAHDHVLIAGAARQAVAWLIDARQHVIVDTVVLSGIATSSASDDSSPRDYLTVQSKDSVDVIDPLSHAVAALWQLPPTSAPQSAAYLPGLGEVIVAGTRGALSSVSVSSGKVIGGASLPIGPGSVIGDGTSPRVITVSSESGSAGVFLADANGTLSLSGSFAVPPGASAGIAVTGRDRSTDLYLAYVSADATELQRFTLPAP